MPLVSADARTPDEMREWDRAAAGRYGIPELLLMENAGRAVADEALRLSAGREGFVAVVCGKGNNGGDGLVAARHILSAGRAVKVFLLAMPSDIPPQSSPGVNLAVLARLTDIVSVAEGGEGALEKSLRGAALVVDAILGTGLKGEVRGLPRRAIEILNQSGVPILAVDTPSGLDGATGEILGAAVRAEATVTFVRPKTGFFLGKGPACVGRLAVTLIGMPPDLPPSVPLSPPRESRRHESRK